MSKPLHELTIAEAAPLIASRDLSPVDLTEAFLARIDALNPRLNAYVCVTAERARADARRAEEEVAAGRYRGPLHGIPLGIKDIYDTGGIATTCHSHVHADRVPERDARSVEMLHEAGAVLLGKLATHEFAFGGPSWDLPFPPARNPWNPEHFTGGSSSGSGSATAGGLAMGAMGSDTAGSIRMPAHFCGIAGIKPTYGRVSRRGVAPLAYSLDHCGPLAWTTRDCALMLGAVAGHDPADPGSVDRPAADYAAALGGDLAGLRVGVIRHFYDGDEHADDTVKSAMQTALGVLTGLGAAVEDVRLSPLQDFHACCMTIMLSEAYAIHEPVMKATPEKYGEIFRDRMMMSGLLSGSDYVQALRLRRQLTAEVEAVLGRYDVLVTAGGWTPAPVLGHVPKFYLFEKPLITTPFDVTGHPAMTVCNGFSAAGLPVGMQIAGRAFDEATVLRVGDAYERATAWRERRPSL
ncbi:MAG: amidase [Alphaproteobacteria bacterium]